MDDLSYMFTHEAVWHMISNMLWLWSFGFILQQLTGNRHLALSFYTVDFGRNFLPACIKFHSWFT
jgi:membrane associated rhomboid family serine protease